MYHWRIFCHVLLPEGKGYDYGSVHPTVRGFEHPKGLGSDGRSFRMNDDIVDVFDHLYWEGAKPITIFEGIKNIQGFDSLPYKCLFVLLCVWLRSSHDVSMQFLYLR